MKKLTKTEREELEALRLYKIEQESRARVKAFARLENLIDSNHDSSTVATINVGTIL